MNELELFRSGLDTMEIATLLRQSEALTYNRLEQLRREERLALQSLHLAQPLIPYAGREAR